MANRKGGTKEEMKFLKNLRGAIGVKSVIVMSLAFFIFAIIGSQALNYLAVAVNSSVDSTVTIVAVTITSILFAVGVALRFLPGK